MEMSRSFAALITFAGSVFLTGCALQTTAAPSPQTLSSFGGQIMGGHQPISGAAITLYDAVTGASAAGYGKTPVTLGTATSDTNGIFTIASNGTTCADPDQLYLVSSGGNTGNGVNTAAVLVEALGSCSFVTTGKVTVIMNEATTIAAAYALSGFAVPDGTSIAIGTSTTNAIGLEHAVSNALNLVTLEGHVNSATVSGNGAIPVALIDTLANSIAACVESTGATDPSCASIFVTPPAGTAAATPTNTWQAALDFALFPASNVAKAYANASPTGGYFQPTLTTQPIDLSLAIAYTAGLQADGATAAKSPLDIAAAADGTIWISGMTGAPLVQLASTGGVLSPAGGYGSTAFRGLTTIGDLAIDTNASPNVWVTSTAGSIYQFSEAGGSLSNTYAAPSGVFINGSTTSTAVQATPYTISIDGSNNIWYGTNGVSAANHTYGELQLSGSTYTPRTAWPVSPLLTTTSDGSTYLALAVNATNGTAQVWSSMQGRTAPDYFDSPYTAAPAAASNSYNVAEGIVFDKSTNVYVVTPFVTGNSTNGRVDRYSTPSTVAYTPMSGAVSTMGFSGGSVMDGNGRLFAVVVPVTPSSTVSTQIAELNTTDATGTGTTQGAGSFLTNTSTTTGITGLGYEPVTSSGALLLNLATIPSLAVDNAGAIWLANSTAGTTTPIIQILGPGAPTPVIAAGYAIHP